MRPDAPWVRLFHHRAFGDYVEIGIGDDGGHLDDHIGVGLEARHLQIDPDEIVAARHTD